MTFSKLALTTLGMFAQRASASTAIEMKEIIKARLARKAAVAHTPSDTLAIKQMLVAEKSVHADIEMTEFDTSPVHHKRRASLHDIHKTLSGISSAEEADDRDLHQTLSHLRNIDEKMSEHAAFTTFRSNLARLFEEFQKRLIDAQETHGRWGGFSGKAGKRLKRMAVTVIPMLLKLSKAKKEHMDKKEGVLADMTAKWFVIAKLSYSTALFVYHAIKMDIPALLKSIVDSQGVDPADLALDKSNLKDLTAEGTKLIAMIQSDMEQLDKIKAPKEGDALDGPPGMFEGRFQQVTEALEDVKTRFFAWYKDLRYGTDGALINQCQGAYRMMTSLITYLRDNDDHFAFTEVPPHILGAMAEFRKSFITWTELKWEEDLSVLRNNTAQEVREQFAERLTILEARVEAMRPMMDHYEHLQTNHPLALCSSAGTQKVKGRRRRLSVRDRLASLERRHTEGKF